MSPGSGGLFRRADKSDGGKGDGGKDQAGDHVPPRKRQAEHAQRRLRAGRAVEGVEVVQQAAGIRGDARRTAGGATGGAFPEAPLQAGAITADAGAAKHHHADRGGQAADDPARQAETCGEDRSDADGDAVVIGIALQKAEGAGDIAADMLEGERPADSGHHAQRDDGGKDDVIARDVGGYDGRYALLLERTAISRRRRSEEHTSELQSLMRTSYAGFCLQQKTSCNSRDRTTEQAQQYDRKST